MQTIILPGWRHNHQHWQRCLDELDTQAVSHYFIDLPGFGHVPPLPTECGFADVVDWVDEQIRDHTQGTPFALCGHSFGGRLAVALAERFAKQCQGLILIGSPNLYRPSRRVRLLKQLVTYGKPLKYLIPQALRKKMRSEDYSALQENSFLHTLYLEGVRTDQAAALRKLSVPVRLLWGENDSMAPLQIAKEMLMLMPQATLETLRNCGHDVHQEKPALTAAIIKSYVKNF